MGSGQANVVSVKMTTKNSPEEERRKVRDVSLHREKTSERVTQKTPQKASLSFSLRHSSTFSLPSCCLTDNNELEWKSSRLTLLADSHRLRETRWMDVPSAIAKWYLSDNSNGAALFSINETYTFEWASGVGASNIIMRNSFHNVSNEDILYKRFISQANRWNVFYWSRNELSCLKRTSFTFSVLTTWFGVDELLLIIPFILILYFSVCSHEDPILVSSFDVSKLFIDECDKTSSIITLTKIGNMKAISHCDSSISSSSSLFSKNKVYCYQICERGHIDLDCMSFMAASILS